MSTYRFQEAEGRWLTSVVESKYETFLVRVLAPPNTRQARKKLEADLTKLKQLVEEESLAG